ncbi:hypothetical protein QE382_003292 [Sphingobacterium zeae]|uniref:Uncharacterized protein n=1 Tax=Sphingobacterium zeae TaxID=1776859 RepID=A0ABU0U8L4_9SPHI|nr:hypothetical protein [Sphingobacterium zeae]
MLLSVKILNKIYRTTTGAFFIAENKINHWTTYMRHSHSLIGKPDKK